MNEVKLQAPRSSRQTLSGFKHILGPKSAKTFSRVRIFWGSNWDNFVRDLAYFGRVAVSKGSVCR